MPPMLLTLGIMFLNSGKKSMISLDLATGILTLISSFVKCQEELVQLTLIPKRSSVKRNCIPALSILTQRRSDALLQRKVHAQSIHTLKRSLVQRKSADTLHHLRDPALAQTSLAIKIHIPRKDHVIHRRAKKSR